MDQRINQIQQNVQDKEELLHSLKDQLDVQDKLEHVHSLKDRIDVHLHSLKDQIDVQDKVEHLHSLKDQLDVLETSLKDQIDVLKSERSIDTEENIPKKSDCNVQTINDPSPPFSEFEIQEGFRHFMSIMEEEEERIEEEQQEIDKRNVERKMHKDMCNFSDLITYIHTYTYTITFKDMCKLSGFITFILTCFKYFTPDDIMRMFSLIFILTIFWKSIDMLFPLSPNVHDNVFLSNPIHNPIHNNDMICNDQTCPAETCKQIRYAGLRRQNRFFTP